MNKFLTARNKFFFFTGVLFLLGIAPLSAYDWGLAADQNASVEGRGAPDSHVTDSLEYSAALIPWLLAPLGKGGDLYISASAGVIYKDGEWNLVPEILRTELNLQIKENGELRIGRMNYYDPLGFIACGLFDGIYYYTEFSDNNSIGAGAWYTGLLYKKTAYITITEDDLDLYYEKLDYADFSGTYFAPRRLIAALDWEKYGIGGGLGTLYCTLIGQFDLSGGERLYHSQYLMVKLVLPVKSFIFEFGICAELAEASKRYYGSFAGELEIGWMPPSSIQDKLTLTARFSNGAMPDHNISAIVPITTVPHGYVLRAKVSGLSMLSLDYTARLHESFSINLSGSYFVLSDLNTYHGSLDGKDGYFLGNEFYGRVIWSPFSDLQITAGGGIFLPMLGNADPKAKVLWRAELIVKLAFF